MKDPYTLKLQEIAAFLKATPFDYNSIGLLQGDLGRLMFFGHYGEATQQEEYISLAVENLERYLENIDVTTSAFTYCSGLAGVGWVVEYMEQKGWLDADTNEILEPIDDFLYEWMTRALEADNYDFLHGAVGTGMYFISRSHKSEKAAVLLRNFAQLLVKKAVVGKDGTLKWFFTDLMTGEKRKDNFNIGLAHGIPSILAFFTKLNESGILPEESLLWTRQTADYIVTHQLNNIEQSGSYFPYTVIDDEPKTEPVRLAWCYGDPGVCCSLWQAATILKNDSLKNFVTKVMINAAGKRDLDAARIQDAGICHGTSGMAHIFQRFYDFTKVDDFRSAADFWYAQTLNMAQHPDGYAGYKAFYNQQDTPWYPTVGMLEGICGIGLALSYRVSGKAPTWEKAFLIS
jgi:lantibiotic modifying enzyme